MADRGIEWTGGAAGLYIAQRLELLEVLSGCETKNKYHIVQIPGGTDVPIAPTGDFNTQWREQSKAAPLLKAKEQSECCERICCPLFRSFTMEFKVQRCAGDARTFRLPASSPRLASHEPI